MNNHSYELDWDAINGFKNLINRENCFDPYIIGRMQKFLLEVCNRSRCRDIFKATMQPFVKSCEIESNASRYQIGNYFVIHSDFNLTDNDIIDNMVLFIRELCNSTIYTIGLSQDTLCTMNQISLMDDNVLRGYIKRAITIFRFNQINNTSGSMDYVLHIMLCYSY